MHSHYFETHAILHYRINCDRPSMNMWLD